MGRPIARSTAREKSARRLRPDQEEMARLAQGEKRGKKLGFRPELRKKSFLFPFSFLTLQMHFQMIFEIIFF
jgi:hypothetical protein